MRVVTARRLDFYQALEKAFLDKNQKGFSRAMLLLIYGRLEIIRGV